MANVKISGLSAASALDGTELVEVVQSGSNKKTTTQDIADLGRGYLVYTALLAPDGAGNPPLVTVLENTLGGAVIWTFDSPDWIGTLVGGFAGTVAGFCSAGAFTVLNKIDNDSVRLEVFSETYASDVTYWGNDQPIEIRVYP